jgi:perosamine synthetase
MIPQMEPWFGDEETRAVTEYLEAGGWITEFRKTREFEEAIAEYTGARYCIVTNNGTISLTLAAMAGGVTAGDDVLVPNYTMIATPNSVQMFGANPVFVDVDPQTLCMRLDLAKQAMTDRTTALMFVTPNGRYPREGIEAWREFASNHNLALIEDSAQSLGSHYPGGVHIGCAGDVGSFSFSAPKVISTGQGGAIVTNNDDIAERVRRLKDFGRASGGNDIHDSIGFNFKFTDVQAAIGLEQMRKLPWRVERKKRILERYQSNLAGTPEVTFFEQDLVNTTPWFIDIMTERRDALVTFLKEKGIGTRTMYPPINAQNAYSRPGSYPVSEEVGRRGLWLPSASQLTDDQIDTVCAAIAEFYGA